MLKFSYGRESDRISNKWPWSFRGIVLLLDKMRGDELPTDFNLHTVPFWIQAHGLQIRVMTKGAGEDLDGLLGEILDVKSNYDGVALIHWVRIQT